jgi:alpha-L-arabinofuranosidase
MKKITPLLILLSAFLLIQGCIKQKPSVITIDLAKEGIAISPDLWGIFYEEINRAGDGGLYPEMIYNRGFEEKNIPSTLKYDTGYIFAPVMQDYENRDVHNWSFQYNIDDKSEGWKLETGAGSMAEMKVVTDKPLDPGTPHSLLLNITGNDGNVTLVNEGFNGIALKSGGKYDLLFYARTQGSYNGRITASLVDSTGKLVAQQVFDMIKNNAWNPYSFSFVSETTDNKASLSLQFNTTGMLWLDYISLLPQQTFKDRKNGLRKDIAQMLADLKPAFIRWPGGCIVEGCTMENRIKWWESIGPPISRKGEFDLWGYYNTYGFGYHEFLQFCEDIGAKGMYVVNSGVSCAARNGDYYEMKDMPDIVQQILGAIEYAVGDVSTKWGAERAKNGHPEPFPLKYIEIGNENSGPVYGERYNMIYPAIKEKYPEMIILNSHFRFTGTIPEYYDADKVDILDPHWYRDAEFFFANTKIFDTLKRGDYELYVGEFACNRGVGTGNIYGALSEAAFMMGMERNSDMVKMASYAPLLENVNYRHWPTNLIRFKNDSVFGRSSYYAQQMFAHNRPDVNLATTLDWMPPADKIAGGGIGFASSSSVTLKNIAVSKGDKAVYSSSFPSDTARWKVVTGNWEVREDGYGSKAIRWMQPGMRRPRDFRGPFTNAIALKDVQLEDMTLSVSIKRDSVFNNLHVGFGMADENNYMQLTIADPSRGRFPWDIRPQAQAGGFIASLNQAIGGSPSDPFSRFGPPTVQIGVFEKKFDFSPDTWHDIKITVEGKQIKLVIDGTVIGQIEYKRPQRQFAIAGYDKAAGEIIVKVVNGEKTPFNTTINLNNVAEIEPAGQIIELYSTSKDDENSFAEPKKVSPQTSTFTKFRKTFDMKFRPYSLTILRIKAKKPS